MNDRLRDLSLTNPKESKRYGGKIIGKMIANKKVAPK